MTVKAEFVYGEWNAICDICGWKYKSSQLRKRWDGKMVCDEDFETRHPSDFIRAKSERLTVPYTAAESTDINVGPTYISTALGVQELTIPTGTFNNSL